MPFDKASADLLFGFISQCYERRSLIVTTNLPFARWSEVFLDATAAAAIIDRIVHRATVHTTTRDNCRLNAATRNQAPRRPQEVPRQWWSWERGLPRRYAPSSQVSMTKTTQQRRVPFLLAISSQLPQARR